MKKDYFCFVIFLVVLVTCPVSNAATVVDILVPRLPPNVNSCPIAAGAAQAVNIIDAYVRWTVDDPNYLAQDGHVTSHGSKAFNHQHALKDFTCQGTLSDGTIVSVSKLSVGAFYMCYWGVDPNITVLAPATMTQNCHGFTTGIGTWILTDALGIGVVVGNDYQPSSVTPDNIFAFAQAGFNRSEESLV